MHSSAIDLEHLVPEIPYERKIHVAGLNAMVLRNQYDPDQGWFDFKDGRVFIYAAIDPPPKPPVHDVSKVLRASKAKFARLDENHRRLFHMDQPIGQTILPFHEHRRMGVKQAKRYEEANWPGFERTPSGELCAIQFPQSDRQRVEDWCEANCAARFRVNKWNAIFESHLDAVQAKLLFQKAINSPMWR